MKYTYWFDWYTMDYMDIGGTEINPGDPVLVYTITDEMTGAETWHIHKGFAESGCPGNLDSTKRCFHGWRGTTNNKRVYAYGVYTVKSVDKISKPRKDGFTGRFIKVVLNKKDIKAGEE